MVRVDIHPFHQKGRRAAGAKLAMTAWMIPPQFMH
jgi:hypothetical protein